MAYRLGLDLGTNSIGWCLLNLNQQQQPDRLLRLGARIFPDGRKPKDGTSLAVDRRLARQMRKRRDRFLRRRGRLLDALIRHGLMSNDATERKKLVTLDPYILRKRGLDESLPLAEFGRALFHLNQRRGFRSNRKVDKSADNESGKIRSAVTATRGLLDREKARTVGEWLARRHEQREPVRARLRGVGAKATYDLYVDRDMIAHEFDALWEKQRFFHPQVLTDAVRDELRDILLYQRPLKPVRPGRCTFEPDDDRAPLALPSSQRFRIYQELNNLRMQNEGFSETPLTREQRDAVTADLLCGKKRSFDQLRRALKLSARFNLESEKRKEIKGCATAAVLGHKNRFGTAWHELPLARQDEIVEKLLVTESEAELTAWLEQECGLSTEAARVVANANLPDGYGRLGRKALSKILPKLTEAVVTYDAAVKAAGYASHSDFYTGEYHDALPYYGKWLERHVGFGSGDVKDSDEKRYGRIANPSVHIGLNQLRKLVNAIIEKYGRPDEIIVEVARDLKLSYAKRREIEIEQAKRQEENEKFRSKLLEQGLPDNADNMLRMRLWTELNPADPANRRCPFTGEPISPTRLFSPEVEIEHLLPFKRSLDDSIPNKTVSLRLANRDKGNNTPFEAFGHSPKGYDWPAILERAQAFPANKRWRFAENAMERYLRDEKDFLARHLNDTAYLSRVAKEYLSAICPPARIWVTPGRLTAMLRAKWGLNSILSGSDRKTRNDHRHHAVDAVVIAVADRALLKRVADAAGRAHDAGLERLLSDMPQPWDGFRDAVESAIERTVVSYKPDHGHQGQLHNDLAYGFVEQPGEDGVARVVRRRKIDEINLGHLGPDSEDGVRDLALRKQLREAVGDATGVEPRKWPAELKKRLLIFSERTGLRRVRVTEKLSVITIPDSPFKGYKGDSNYAFEIYRKENGQWDDNIVTTFEANRVKPQRLRDRHLALNGKPLVMRLCKNDLVAIEKEGKRQIMRVAGVGKTLTLTEHREANTDDRNRDKDNPFKYQYPGTSALHKLKARRVFIDLLGRVLDPGFRP
jgi:CRISPR-associated endonuclease Csn1